MLLQFDGFRGVSAEQSLRVLAHIILSETDPKPRPKPKPKPPARPRQPVELPAVLTPDTRLTARQAAMHLNVKYGTFRIDSSKIKKDGYGRFKVADLDRYSKIRQPKPKKRK